MNTLLDLDRKIQRLRLHAKDLEKQMDQRLDYFQDNYSSMILKSFLPAVGLKGGVVGGLAGLVSQHHRLQDSVSRLADQLFDRISDGMEFIADKLEKKKKEND